MLPRPPVILQLGALRAKAMLWRGDDSQLRITVAVGATFDMVNGAPSELARIQHAPTDAQLVPQKARVDVLLRAAAHTLSPVEQLDVSAIVGAMKKRLAITGDRCWTEGTEGVVAGPPTPFEYMPIDNLRGVRSALNPDGVGFEQHDGQVLPNIAVGGPHAASMMPGYGALSPEVRAARAVLTHAQRQWLERGIPEGKAAPPGFEGDYFNLAPPEQRIGRFEGKQRLSFRNLHPSHSQFDTTIDVPTPAAVWQSAGQHWPLSLRCDTVEVDLLLGTIQLTIRGFAIVGDQAQLGVGTIMVSDTGGAAGAEPSTEQQTRMETTVIVPYQPDVNRRPLPFVDNPNDTEPYPIEAVDAAASPPFGSALDSEATYRWSRESDDDDTSADNTTPRDTAELELAFDGLTSTAGDLPFTSEAVSGPATAPLPEPRRTRKITLTVPGAPVGAPSPAPPKVMTPPPAPPKVITPAARHTAERATASGVCGSAQSIEQRSS